jgi:hypothetical protein
MLRGGGAEQHQSQRATSNPELKPELKLPRWGSHRRASVITAFQLQVNAIKKARSSAADRAKLTNGLFAPARHRAGRGKVMSTIVPHRHE